MQTTPTTAQILDGVRADLRTTILSELASEPARITVEMLDNVLANLAVRAAHEIAWMRDECERIDALAAGVDDVAVVAALAEYRATDRTSLHLDDVRVGYDRASEVLSCVVEHALATDDVAVLEGASALLRLRSDREMEILGDWNMAGRG